MIFKDLVVGQYRRFMMERAIKSYGFEVTKQDDGSSVVKNSFATLGYVRPQDGNCYMFVRDTTLIAGIPDGLHGVASNGVNRDNRKVHEISDAFNAYWNIVDKTRQNIHKK